MIGCPGQAWLLIIGGTILMVKALHQASSNMADDLPEWNHLVVDVCGCWIAAVGSDIGCEHHLHVPKKTWLWPVIHWKTHCYYCMILLELDRDMNLKRCSTWSLTVCLTVKSKNHCATLDFVHGGSRNFQSCQIACAVPRMSFERKHQGPKEKKWYPYINCTI